MTSRYALGAALPAIVLAMIACGSGGTNDDSSSPDPGNVATGDTNGSTLSNGSHTTARLGTSMLGASDTSSSNAGSDQNGAGKTGSNADGGTSSGSDASTGTDAGSSGTDASTPKDAGGSGSPGTLHPPSTPPTKTCSYSPDASGFFKLTSAKGDYWVRLPKGYDKTKKTPLVLGLHGCGDTAQNFVTWGSDPYNNNTSLRENDDPKFDYIAVAVEDVATSCWSTKDTAKVLAALDDATACFYVDQAHVTIAGYSSGAAVAYLVGLQNAARFSGILIEDGALYDNGAQEATLLANAAWKINIAHVAHQSDADYPLASVQADWTKIKNAGFPLTTSTVAGTHDGTSTDWYSFLLPKIAGWTAP